MRVCRFILALCIAAVLGVSCAPMRVGKTGISAPAGQESELKRVGSRCDRPGLYLRLAKQERERNPEFFLRHPLVDAVIVTFGWADIEPAPGRYDFSGIDRILGLCRKHNKGVVLAIATYGQSPGAQPTPEWLYGKGVKGISFSGGGVAKGAMITVPKAWEGPYLAEYEKLIRALGERYDPQSEIWFVMPGFGHIGNINAQPSKDGCPAFLAEGWTPDKWKEHCRQVARLYKEAFPRIPLIVKSAKQLLEDRERNSYAQEADEILVELAGMDISIITFGLEPDAELLRKNGILDRLAQLKDYALAGKIRLGIGDDWPLWLPEDRRNAPNQRHLSGRDVEGLEGELTYAFGGVEGLPYSYISLIYVLHQEIIASHPETNPQNKEVYGILAATRERLIQEDPTAKILNSGSKKNAD